MNPPTMRSVRVSVQRLNIAKFYQEEIARAEKEVQNREKSGLKDAFPINREVIKGLKALKVLNEGK
ncbi:hypothetical protein DAPPUDRAFT_337157 [Daphnia pulex]|uniref:Uncharacterized protein n=1 Tax=Daphnia pulex TaxID=6669 RepID=E9I143_DAPPU|nr:hypothetical protein DAPPUDRAFT_337157 [Daphnia pulex]|eukprot:EFX62287.1 hypothetical protein DAPPUDRAFT_337157 [Daphnia pulex]